MGYEQTSAAARRGIAMELAAGPRGQHLVLTPIASGGVHRALATR